MDKLKTENSKNNQPSPPQKLKLTQEEILSHIQIKSIEKNCLDRVFKLLSSLQGEESSDEDSVAKIYKKQIESKANQKKMKIAVSTYVSKTSMQNTKKTSKGFKEDDEKAFNDCKGDEDHSRKGMGKVSVKAIRKILRTLCNEYPKEEMDSMVWEVDENLDGYVCENEFEKMYKRCITDEKEQQPKKLFYLVQFLMYDKEKKGYITEEDTLEILYIRHGDKFNEAIDAIFDIEEMNEKAEIKKKGKRETLTYVEYAERMHVLSMRKREKTTNKRKLFCEKVQKEWKTSKK